MGDLLDKSLSGKMNILWLPHGAMLTRVKKENTKLDFQRLTETEHKTLYSLFYHSLSQRVFSLIKLALSM